MIIDVNDIRKATNNDGSVIAIDLIIEKLEEIDEKFKELEYKIRRLQVNIDNI
jgi:hypothetical protein